MNRVGPSHFGPKQRAICASHNPIKKTGRPRRYGERMRNDILKPQLARRMKVHRSLTVRAMQTKPTETIVIVSGGIS